MSTSLLGLILNSAPVAYTGTRRSLALPFAARNGAEAQMRAMGSVGTLFAIVNRTSNAAAQVDWKLWRKAASGKKEDRVEVTSHLALDIWNKPNPFFPRQRFIETIQQHVDLTGEGWWVIARNPLMRSIPLELWPVRPDRMTPVPHAEKFLAGYIYTSPDGEQVPLALDEVIQLRMPNPLDPYRGLGPVQSILTDLDSTRYSAEWNRNFFKNSAEPGGIIEVDKRLSDDEFDEMTSRWREQHQGVANAHRVAVLEQGKWVDRKYTMRDMQFAELRNLAREVIHEAFGLPQFMTGKIVDANRAAAKAAKALFAEDLTVPRLERFKGALNSDFLPLFGSTAKGLEFDYESPVPEDEEVENATRTSKAASAKTYIDAGFTGESVMEALDLPDALVWEKPVPKPPHQVAIVPPDGNPPADPATPPPVQPAARLRNAAATPPEVDLTAVQADWETSVDQLTTDWQDVTAAQRQELAQQVEDAVSAGDLAALAALAAASTLGAALLLTAMLKLATIAGEHVVGEAAAQGVTITAASVTAATYEPVANATAALLASGLAQSAGREALRLYTADAVGVDVAQAVTTHLEALSDATLRAELGGALTRAQNSARLATLSIAPLADYWASEVLDKNTCGPCRKIDGHQFDNLIEAYGAYAGGPYWACEGGVRCRGTVVASWNEQVA